MTSAPLDPVPIALCLGGVDPSGGAGLLRDAATLQSLGIHTMAVSTAETIQNGIACLHIEAPAVDPLRRLESLRPHLAGNWGVKLGLWALPLGALDVLATHLAGLGPRVLIWDPVQAPTVGPGHHDPATLRAMARILLGKLPWVVAPNRLEAASVAGLEPGQERSPEALASPFLDLGAAAVWLKGGHTGGSRVQDFWISGVGVEALDDSPRLPGELRGTGCALAAAWLGFRLSGSGEVDAARQAASWLRGQWASAFSPGGAGRPVLAPVGGR